MLGVGKQMSDVRCQMLEKCQSVKVSECQGMECTKLLLPALTRSMHSKIDMVNALQRSLTL